MKTQNIILLPRKYALPGIFLVISGLFLGLFTLHFGFEIPGFGLKIHPEGDLLKPAFNNFTDELALLLLLLGLLTLCYRREKVEDEYIEHLRLKSWQWSGIVYAISLVLGGLLIYNVNFWAFLVYNMFTPFIAYLVIFRVLIFSQNKQLSHD